jgi:hypothetical protein
VGRKAAGLEKDSGAAEVANNELRYLYPMPDSGMGYFLWMQNPAH